MNKRSAWPAVRCELLHQKTLFGGSSKSPRKSHSNSMVVQHVGPPPLMSRKVSGYLCLSISSSWPSDLALS